ncbi:MAG TPA: hypothetical protein VE990_12545 [Acidimicrobiales bacterium]|nr:hypothetical protein [Acidimicrobiales bacterium]
MLECVVNLSEGRRPEVVAGLARAGGPAVLDVHSDPDHNRSVVTLAGEAGELATAVRAVAAVAVATLDLRSHQGVHPRLGVLDVVPFVPLSGATMDDAVRLRDDFAAWAGEALGLPCFLYGPERSLPDVRRGAFRGLRPDTGPPRPHPVAGAAAVGARPVLVAYNLWLADPDLDAARAIARSLRSPAVRALAFAMAGTAQVSFNLVEPLSFGPLDAYRAVASRAEVGRAELVGLLPRSALERIPEASWAELDLGMDRTIEARLARRRSGAGATTGPAAGDGGGDQPAEA